MYTHKKVGHQSQDDCLVEVMLLQNGEEQPVEQVMMLEFFLEQFRS